MSGVERLASLMEVAPGESLALAGIVFLAGIVRGFTGFALSAFTLSLAVLILPPVALIPVLFWLELAASVAMARTGWRDADRKAALLLIAGATVGGFAGVGATVALDPGVSRIVALVMLVALAALQLSRLRVPGLATSTGTAVAGVVAGVATGLASIGGMVVALFVLARDDAPPVMRSTLVLYLLGTLVTGLATLLWWGVMTPVAVLRGLILTPVCLAGVLLGMRMFTPRWQGLYRPLCLGLLIGLGLVALIRSLLGAGS